MPDNEIDPRILAAFSSADGDAFDESAAEVHVRAIAHLESLGVVVDEQNYADAVEVVDVR